MITKLKFNNCFAFNKPIEMSLKADMRAKRLISNVMNIDENVNILKSAVLYGPNNTGKTAFINCVRAMKNTLLNQKILLNSNIFNSNRRCEASISFIDNNREYTFSYIYDHIESNYVYEKMNQIVKDKYGNEKEEIIYIKDTINNIYECSQDKNLGSILNITSNSNILIYTLQIDKFELLQKIKKMLVDIANKIEIVDMNNIPNKKTIEILKDKNEITKKLVSFIKNADLYLDDYKYEENLNINIETDTKEHLDEILKDQNLVDQIKLISVYKGKQVPSFLFDSLGTKKFAALASYIIEALEYGKTLFIDELDSSLHSKITRSIINMFNNELNINAQLIATLHDTSLLDCKRMFRKEQIWFTDKDMNETKLYSLKEFTYAGEGIRDTIDIQDRYSKGVFGAIPEPDLILTLLEDTDGED